MCAYVHTCEPKWDRTRKRLECLLRNGCCILKSLEMTGYSLFLFFHRGKIDMAWAILPRPRLRGVKHVHTFMHLSPSPVSTAF